MFWEQMSFSSQTKLQTSPNPNIPNRMTIMWVLMYLSPKELGWLFFAINKSHQWPTGATNYWCPVLYLKSNTINHLCILTASIGQGRRNPHPRCSEQTSCWNWCENKIRRNVCQQTQASPRVGCFPCVLHRGEAKGHAVTCNVALICYDAKYGLRMVGQQ